MRGEEMISQATNTHTVSEESKDSVVTKALMNVGRDLNISPDVLASIVGKNRSSLYRPTGIKANSKSGELALVMIRCYRALFALMGGNYAAMQHWFNTYNNHTGGVPIEQAQKLEGLMSVSRYLDAIRGKN